MINRLLKKSCRQTWFKPYTTGLVFGLLIVMSASGILIPNTTHALVFANIVNGYVYTRGLVRGPNGQPILVVYGENGQVLDIRGEMIGDFEDAKIMSADEFNGLLEAFRTFRQQHQDGIARGARLLDRATYTSTSFQTLDGVAINKPGLANNTQSVYVRGSRTLLTPETELVLFESPLNLTLYADSFQLAGGTKSVLVNRDGGIIEQSPYNYGYQVAYGKEGESECTVDTAVSPEDDDRLIKFYEGHRPCVPVAGAELQAFSAIVGDTYTYSRNDGKFAMTILNPICPGFYFEYTNIVFSYMYYSDFNPKRKGMDLFFAEPRYTYAGCVGYGASPMFPNVVPNPAMNLNMRFPVDVIVVSGTGAISNLGVPGQSAEPLPFGDTEHETELPVFSPQIPVGLDLDADGLEDKAILHEGKVYVYLGGRNIKFDDNGAPIEEDLRRLPDQLIAGGLPDTQHQGLLSQVSEEDLQQTDIYIYRVSNGKRIGELRGIKENEFRDGLLDEDGTWYYRIMLATGFNPESRQQVGWRNRAGIEDMKLEREADHLRIGENLKLIAINRKTGYTGTMITQLKAAQGGRIDFPVDEIVLRPPNLRISAERKYQVEKGLTQGEDREYIIGFEGSALTSDQYIAITTEWFDHDGTPLPGDLPGYTGRLAQLVAENQLGDSQVGQFDVKPGRRLQLVALNGIDIQNKHYYVHVSGYPKDENPDFTTLGAGQGVLEHRPRYYVPFLVPVYNEKQSLAELNAYNQARQAYAEGTITEAPLKPTPTYIRAYRPEMQFSVFSLTVNEINIGRDDNNNQLIDDELINLIDDNTPLIPSDNYLQLLYDLIAPGLAVMDSFGPGTELIFNLAGNEATATIGEDGQIVFNDLRYFEMVDQSDYLTLQLISNQDAGNVLWEYAFLKNGLHVYYQIPDPKEETEIVLLGTDENEDTCSFTCLTRFVRTLGGIRLKYQYILPAGGYFDLTNTNSISWNFGVPGRYCTKPGISKNECIEDNSGHLDYNVCHFDTQKDIDEKARPTRCYVYWEPLDGSDTYWKTGLNSFSAVRVNHKRKDNTDRPAFQPFMVQTRVIERNDTKPMQGSDIEMLEALLWHFGISPQNGYTGFEGTRLGAHSASLGGYVGGKEGIAARREYSALNTGKSAGSLEKMVRRFQGRNISAEEDGKLERNMGDTSSGIVDNDSLADLKRIWKEYYTAYERYKSTGLISKDDSRIDAWLAAGVAIWDNGAGPRAPATYSQMEHVSMLQTAGLTAGSKDRKELLRSWKIRESEFHWGTGHPATLFRMHEGGADEYGSLSFNQVLYMYRYSNKPCSVHKESGLNFYDPAENIQGFAVHTASDNTSAADEERCHGSFWEAYVHNGLTASHGTEGPLSYRQTTVENRAVQARDDSYELLMKAIAGYNGHPARFKKNSWPMLLKDRQKPIKGQHPNEYVNTDTLCYSCGYAIGVMNQYGIGSRSYVWHGGTGRDVDGKGTINDISDNPATPENESVIETTVPWCFVYGEAEWMAGEMWGKVKADASNTDAFGKPQTPVGQIPCP